MHPLFADIKNFAADTLFPITCLSCDEPGKFVCGSCLALFAKLEHQRCIMCQKPSLHGMTHESCSSPQAPDGCLSVFDYHDQRIANILVQAKYKFLPETYRLLGHALADFIKSERLQNYFAEYVTCPVPLYKQRLRWRGFNQAEILAQTLSERLSLSFEPSLDRTHNTKTQKDLNKEARNKNITGAFALHQPTVQYNEVVLDWLFNYEKPPRVKLNVRGKGVLLIDDVVTTGSTLIEASQVLKRNGAKSVWCVTVARD